MLLQFHRQPYYTRLQRAVIDTLTRECPALLARNRMQGDGEARSPTTRSSPQTGAAYARHNLKQSADSRALSA